MVRYLEEKGEAPDAGPGAGDGQIAALKQQRNRIDALDIEGIQDLLADLDVLQARQEIAPALEQLDEEARAAGLEPEVSEAELLADEQQDVVGGP